MAVLPLESVLEGDILAKDVKVGDVVLFGAGTVLARKFIDILKMLGVKEVDIENREGGKFKNIKEVFQNIDKRFSYVEDNPFMMSLKYLAKDVATTTRGGV